VGKSKRFDVWSLLVITATMVLFLAALFVKGLTHELLLEAGVFLVSIKLIYMSYKNGLAEKAMLVKMDEILSVLERSERDSPVEGR
jgi:hypothetical protein